jgi:hypothetical protein
MQPETPNVVALMAAVMNEITAVGKDGRNTSQNYNFRGVDAVVNAAGPAFRKHGVVPMPRVLSSERATVEVGKNRSLMREVVLKVAYDFHGPAGDVLTAEVEAEALDSGDKATSKAMSVAYRTALLQVLAIPTDDPDPDSVSYERAAVPEVDPKHALVIRQKKLLVAACGGDGEMAKQLWGDSHDPLTEQALATAIETAGQMTAGEAS